MKLTKIKTIRFSEEDTILMDKLRSIKIKPDDYIRTAFRSKIKQELQHLIEQEEIDYPF